MRSGDGRDHVVRADRHRNRSGRHVRRRGRARLGRGRTRQRLHVRERVRRDRRQMNERRDGRPVIAHRFSGQHADRFRGLLLDAPRRIVEQRLYGRNQGGVFVARHRADRLDAHEFARIVQHGLDERDRHRGRQPAKDRPHCVPSHGLVRVRTHGFHRRLRRHGSTGRAKLDERGGRARPDGRVRVGGDLPRNRSKRRCLARTQPSGGLVAVERVNGRDSDRTRGVAKRSHAAAPSPARWPRGPARTRTWRAAEYEDPPGARPGGRHRPLAWSGRSPARHAPRAAGWCR